MPTFHKNEIKVFSKIINTNYYYSNIDNILKISKEGSSADKQIKIYKDTRDMQKVVDFLIDETTKHCIS